MNYSRIVPLAFIGLLLVSPAAEPSPAQTPSPSVDAGNATTDVNANIGTAARKGDLATVSALLKKPGADVNARGLQEKTPLMWAALYGHLKTVEGLVAAGARLEEKDSGGGTALNYAQVAWHEHVVAFLKRKGAQPTTMDKMTAVLWGLTQPTDVFEYMNKRADEAKKKQ